MHEARMLRVADQILSALVEAHGGGIIHRDLKPDNIMLTVRQGNPDYAKVLDFGLAKVFGDMAGDETITQVGMVTGTPRYMSPEQARGLKLDARTDIYSLGVMLYETLTGKHPFDAESALDFMHKHTSAAVPSPGERVAGLQIMPRTEALLMKCLAKDPKERFQSAREMQREVRNALRDFPDAVPAHPTPEEERVATSPTVGATTALRRVERRKLVTAVAVLAVATLVLVVVVLLMFAQASWESREAASGGANAAAVSSPAVEGAVLPLVEEVPSSVASSRKVAPADTSSEILPVVPVAAEATKLPTMGDGVDDLPSEAELRAEIESAVATALAAQLKDLEGNEAGIVLVPPAAGGLPILSGDRGSLSGLAFARLAVTADAEMVTRTAEVLNYATALGAEPVLKLYRDWASAQGFKVRDASPALLIETSTSPIQTVSYAENSSMTSELPHLVSVVLREEFAGALEIGDLVPFGVPVYPGAEVTTITAQAIIYEVMQPVEKVAPFYADLFADKDGVMITRNRVMRSDQLVVFSQRPEDAFMTITVMSSMTKRNETQIVVTSRAMMSPPGVL